ncbi:hypothetical protein AVL48_02675 [Amycolatopsis regifaucium]|uniref:Uncharacterized protein n=1 Tax=Amycolatopsis regifaucium TaxID=546365 RepID=A0A154MNW7_9PSEU|nr:hypothetical protein AVL48_02675 [Amycolatopsis regifaucium]OKA04143.1 hypothetical protein ATP06_0233535 [Amycolatopsis regifaucium]
MKGAFTYFSCCDYTTLDQLSGGRLELMIGKATIHGASRCSASKRSSPCCAASSWRKGDLGRRVPYADLIDHYRRRWADHGR